MGIEPTQNGTSALQTVLKTAGPTRTLPPPLSGASFETFEFMIHGFGLLWKKEDGSRGCVQSCGAGNGRRKGAMQIQRGAGIPACVRLGRKSGRLESLPHNITYTAD
jgi:hypothetical protein